MRIIQSRTFEKRVRRFRKQEKEVLDQQVRKIAENPAIGQEKRGELRGVFVHKFKIHATQYLLSYRMADADSLELIKILPDTATMRFAITGASPQMRRGGKAQPCLVRLGSVL